MNLFFMEVMLQHYKVSRIDFSIVSYWIFVAWALEYPLRDVRYQWAYLAVRSDRLWFVDRACFALVSAAFAQRSFDKRTVGNSVVCTYCGLLCERCVENPRLVLFFVVHYYCCCSRQWVQGGCERNRCWFRSASAWRQGRNVRAFWKLQWRYYYCFVLFSERINGQ